MSGSTTAQSLFDKGLRGPPAEQLATIARLSRLLEDNPTPTFVNSMLIRTADAFKDGSLDLRVAISRSLKQCGSQLTLAFSVAEIFRRILTVSHSNDPNARETTLDVLATIAPLQPESNTVHHRIRESLNTSHDGEFRAACAALKSYASISQAFAESVVSQIGKILEEDDVSESRKVIICSAFSTMRATANVVDRVFAVADKVLRRTISDEYFCSFLESTTSMCIEIRYPVPKQVDLLLTLLHPPDREIRRVPRVRKLICLRELKRLAKFSNMWNENQVQILSSTLSPALSDRCLADFFETTIGLTKNCPQANLQILKTLILSNTGFGSHANPEVSVRFVQLASKIVCSPKIVESSTPDDFETMMTSLTVVIVNTCTCGKLKPRIASRLFRAVGDLLVMFPYSEHGFSEVIITSVFSAFESSSFNDNNQKERLEMFCRLVDSEKMYVADLHGWACEVIRKKTDLFQAHPNLFSYLALAVGTELPAGIEPFLLRGSPLRYFETAKIAFRTGKWEEVATLNIDQIDFINMPKMEREWLAALQELAHSQISKLTLDNLEEQQNHLMKALAIMRTSRTSPRMESTLRFPIGMLSAMLASSYAFFHVLSVIRPFSTYLSSALQFGSPFFNPTVARRFLSSVAACEVTINEALNEWSALCRASFTADATSFDLITFYYMRVSILQMALRVLLKKQSPDTIIQIPPLTQMRTCSQFQKERLQWVAERIRYIRYDTVPNMKTIKCLFVVLEQLAIIPYMLPRFFFQRFYNVDFKISTTPQSEKDKPIQVVVGETLPIRVDGSIISNHPSKIRSVIVFADVSCHSSQLHNQNLQEEVQPRENDYFTAQFLLTFKQPCDVKFRIEFVDQTSRKQWKADGGASLSIAVREVVAAGHDMRRPPGAMPYVRTLPY